MVAWAEKVTERFGDMQKAFRFIDVNKSGKLDQEDFARALALWHLPPPPGGVAALVATCDETGDGRVTFAELCRALTHLSATVHAPTPAGQQEFAGFRFSGRGGASNAPVREAALPPSLHSFKWSADRIAEQLGAKLEQRTRHDVDHTRRLLWSLTAGAKPPSASRRGQVVVTPDTLGEVSGRFGVHCQQPEAARIFQMYGLDPTGATVQQLSKAFREPRSSAELERSCGGRTQSYSIYSLLIPFPPASSLPCPPKSIHTSLQIAQDRAAASRAPVRNPYAFACLPEQAWREHNEQCQAQVKITFKDAQSSPLLQSIPFQTPFVHLSLLFPNAEKQEIGRIMDRLHAAVRRTKGKRPVAEGCEVALEADGSGSGARDGGHLSKRARQHQMESTVSCSDEPPLRQLRQAGGPSTGVVDDDHLDELLDFEEIACLLNNPGKCSELLSLLCSKSGMPILPQAGCLLLKVAMPHRLAVALLDEAQHLELRGALRPLQLLYRRDNNRLREVSGALDVEASDELMEWVAATKAEDGLAEGFTVVWSYFDIDAAELHAAGNAGGGEFEVRWRQASAALLVEAARLAVMKSGAEALAELPWLRRALREMTSGARSLEAVDALRKLSGHGEAGGSGAAPSVALSSTPSAALPSACNPSAASAHTPSPAPSSSRSAATPSLSSNPSASTPSASTRSAATPFAAPLPCKPSSSARSTPVRAGGKDLRQGAHTLEGVALEAEALRSKLLLVAPAQTQLHELWAALESAPPAATPAATPAAPEAPLSDYLASLGLQLGDPEASHRLEPGHPLALFGAVCRAAFGSEEHAARLRELCVRYVRLSRDKAGQQDVNKAWQFDAVEQGKVAGFKWTIPAIVQLLHVEVRVLVCESASLFPSRQDAPARPEIQAKPYTLPSAMGKAKMVIYLASVAAEKRKIECGGAQGIVVWRRYFSLEPHEDIGRWRRHGEADTDSQHYSEYERPLDWPQRRAAAAVVSIGGAQFTLADLEEGANDDEKAKLWRDPNDNRVYRVHRSGAKESVEVDLPPAAPLPICGEWMRKRASDDPPSSPIGEMETPEDDVKVWIRLFQKGRWGEGALNNETNVWLVQKLDDMLAGFVEALKLQPGDDDAEGQLDRMGATVCGLQRLLRALKLEHFAQPASERRPPVILAGGEGLGKSFTTNKMVRSSMPADSRFSKFKQTRVHPSAQGLVALRFPGDRVEMEPIRIGEEEVWEQYVKDVELLVNQVEEAPDIAPSGCGLGAMTGLPNQFHLNPKADHMELKITYRALEDVERVLSAAAARRNKLLDELHGTHETRADGVDGADEATSMTICEALGMLGVNVTNDTPEDCLRDWKGPLELPQYIKSLLGRVRTWHIEAPTGRQMAEELRKLLLLHTVGHWSRWPLISSIEIVVPSERFDLHIWDLPGFGDKLIDTYRQHVVVESLKKRCSSMLLLLDDRANAQVRPYLEEANVYFQLFGDKRLRTVGQIVTVKAIDKNYRNTKVEAFNEDAISRVRKNAQEQRDKSRGWMKKMMEEAMKGQLKPASGLNPGQRIEKVVSECTQHFAVDVQGKFARAKGYSPGALEEEQLQRLIEALVANCDAAEQLRQRLFLAKLVSTVLLPFITQCQEVLQLREFEKDSFGVKLRSKQAWLNAFLEFARSMLDRKSFVDSMRSACKEYLDPRAEMVSTTAVNKRYSEPPFDEYKRPRTRTLGEHLKAERPEAFPSMLRQLLLPELSDEATLVRLGDVLRAWKEAFLFTALGKLEKQLLDQLNNIFGSEGGGDERNVKGDDKSKVLVGAIKPTLRKHVRKLRDQFSLWYDEQVEKLPQGFNELIRNEMRRGKRPFTHIAKKSNNELRRSALAEAAPMLAKDVARQVPELLIKLLEPFLEESSEKGFVPNFHDVLRRVYHHLDCVCKKDTSALDRLDAFVVSSHYLRLSAGLVKALHASNLAHECFEDYPELQDILNFATQPAGLAPKVGKGLVDVNYQPDPPATTTLPA
ncbi:hypothetical protein AB1Y20_016197 [Prymnesium parvum]|uniref:EF-hand domain-containing protein n=1 Tax=Prymnesium parvum TaxID=97485 RepID=A0AB34IF94_PRYPA